jgi:dTDP-glucose pyrophosphorylase
MIKEFGSIIINWNLSIKEAMKQLDKTAEKILFVIDDDSHLVGSLTDGDIRRWILSDGNIESAVKYGCNKNTYFVNINYDINKVKYEIMQRRIVYVPVIDKERNIVEFLVWDKLFDGQIRKRPKNELKIPVVIMAGGKGTRLDPFTKILPKPLIPIGDKTILEIIIDKFLDYDVCHFYITVNHKAKIIKSYFEELDFPYKITFLQENKPLGTGGSLKYLENRVNGPFIVTNCDILIDADYSDILDFHIQKKNDITIVASMKNINIPYGVCEIENGGTLTKILEKPEYNFLVSTGMYILNSDTLPLIPENEFFHITHLMEKLKSQGGKIGVYPISDHAWTDTGEWGEYKKAIELFGVKYQ